MRHIMGLVDLKVGLDAAGKETDLTQKITIGDYQ